MVRDIRIQNGWPPVEIWFQDEARIGQKNKITRRWARRGTRPRAPHDQRRKWAYIFGVICPAEGKGAGLVMPWADTHAMAEHLKLISAEVAPGAHAILIVDQAGWHMSPKLEVPENITLLALPPRSPELNPVENIWQFIRPSRRRFATPAGQRKTGSRTGYSKATRQCLCARTFGAQQKEVEIDISVMNRQIRAAKPMIGRAKEERQR